MKTVLITGAKGTVGNYAVALAEAARHRVVVTDISRPGLRTPVRGEVRVADLTEPGVVPTLLRGVDYVIHTAAQMNASASAAELSAINADAVAALYDAACEAGVKRFVHLSTATLYAPGEGEPIDESHPLAPRGPYGLSKRAAEMFLRGRTGPRDIPWVILRPAPIYGRRGRHFGASLLAYGPLARLASPVVPRPSGGPLGTMVHAEDVARAALFVMEHDAVDGRIFNVADGDVMALGDRLGATLDAYGLRSVSLGAVSSKVLDLSGKLFAQAGPHRLADTAALASWRYVVARHRLKPSLRPHLDREAIPLLRHELIVSDAALRDLGFVPRHRDFASGWADVLRWYQAEGWVPRY